MAFHPENRIYVHFDEEEEDLMMTSPFALDPRSESVRVLNVADTVINVEVGEPSKQVFHIHQSILTSSSEFLKSHAKPEWSQGGTQLKLPEHTTEAFQIYATWLYTRVIPKTSRTYETSGSKTDNEWRVLAEAYILGEYLMDVAFKDTVLDALRAKSRVEGGKVFLKMPEFMTIVYRGTSPDSVARKFIIDMHLRYADLADFDTIASHAPVDFFRDPPRAFMAKRALMSPNAFNGPRSEKCAYHDHGKDRPTVLLRWKDCVELLMMTQLLWACMAPHLKTVNVVCLTGAVRMDAEMVKTQST